MSEKLSYEANNDSSEYYSESTTTWGDVGLWYNGSDDGWYNASAGEYYDYDYANRSNETSPGDGGGGGPPLTSGFK